jgi:hypothetical protein
MSSSWGPGGGQGGSWGPPPGYGGSWGPQWPRPGHDFGDRPTTAMVLGIAGIACCPPVGLGALVVGELVRREARNEGAPMPGQAIAGYVLGWLSVAMTLAWVVFFLVAGDS